MKVVEKGGVVQKGGGGGEGLKVVEKVEGSTKGWRWRMERGLKVVEKGGGGGKATVWSKTV